MLRMLCDGCYRIVTGVISVGDSLGLCNQCYEALDSFCLDCQLGFPNAENFDKWQCEREYREPPEPPFYVIRRGIKIKIKRFWSTGTDGNGLSHIGHPANRREPEPVPFNPHRVPAGNAEGSGSPSVIYPIGYGCRFAWEAGVRATRVLWAQEQYILRLQMKQNIFWLTRSFVKLGGIK